MSSDKLRSDARPAAANAAGGVSAAPLKRPAFEPTARLLTPTGYDPDMKRPGSTVAGAVLVLLGAVAGLLVISGLTAVWPEWMQSLDAELTDVTISEEQASSALLVIVIATGAVYFVEAVLAVLIYLGFNWPRVLVMVLAALSISAAFTQWWVEDQEITIQGTLLTLCFDILILLALSSRSAAAYARRKQRR